jgi:hypothetical protein
MKTHLAVAVVAGAALSATLLYAQNKVTEKPFVSGGRIELWLSAGDFEVKPAAGNLIRVTITGAMGNTKVELTANGTQGKVVLRDSPNNNFGAVIEVPKVADLMIRMYAGDLNVGGIAGSKDIESKAGDVRIDAGPAADYASVNASVNIGDLSPGPFGDAKGSFLRRASTGQGNLHAAGHASQAIWKLQ